jgi:nitrite reductase (NO-forming)
MKAKSLLIASLASVFGIAMITACGGGGQKGTTESAQVEEAADPAAQLARGEQIYKEKCFACHQADGQGLPNVFPTLTGSDFLLNNTRMAVAQVLNGSEKVSSGNAVNYPAPMPPQLDNHEDAVAVINYVLKNFGNDGKLITVEDVKDIAVER